MMCLEGGGVNTTFWENGYSQIQIRQAVPSMERVTQDCKDPPSVAFLSYFHMTSNKQDAVQTKHSVCSPVTLEDFQLPLSWD
jgi:hypothetical protein